MAPMISKRIDKAQAREEFSALIEAKPNQDARGFFVLSDDLALEDASRKVKAEFKKSLKKTASQL